MSGSLSERQKRERGLTGLAELARIDLRTGTVNAVAGRALDLAGSLLDADRAAVCAITGDETIEWLAQRRLERLIAASADLRPSQLSWISGPLETGRAELVDRRSPGHQRSPLSDAADALGVAAFAIVPVRSGDAHNGVLGLAWSDDPPDLARDAELLTTIGRLIGLALGNVRLRDELVTRQRQLDESEARYRGLFEQAPQPLLIADWDGRVLDVNAAALALYGSTRRRMLASSLERLTELSREDLRRLLGRLHRSRRAVAETRGRRADKGTFDAELQVAVSAFRGEERVFVQLRDLATEVRHDMGGDVEHPDEVDRSLSAVVAFGQMVAGDRRVPADLRREAELMLEEATRARDMARTLLERLPGLETKTAD